MRKDRLHSRSSKTAALTEPCRQVAQNIRAVHKNPIYCISPPRPLSATATQTVALCTSNHICDIAHSARPLSKRLCAGYPAQPSTLRMPSGGPPITERTWSLAKASPLPGSSDLHPAATSVRIEFGA
jgi:hypothetical protein